MDPILENAIDRIHHMNEQERNQLYLGLVRFLGIFMAEVLRLLAMALLPEGDATSLVQCKGWVRSMALRFRRRKR